MLRRLIFTKETFLLKVLKENFILILQIFYVLRRGIGKMLANGVKKFPGAEISIVSI